MSHSDPPHSLVKYEGALLVSGGTAEQVPTGEKPSKTQTEEILNSILPPREWNQARLGARGRRREAGCGLSWRSERVVLTAALALSLGAGSVSDWGAHERCGIPQGPHECAFERDIGRQMTRVSTTCQNPTRDFLDAETRRGRRWICGTRKSRSRGPSRARRT